VKKAEKIDIKLIKTKFIPTNYSVYKHISTDILNLKILFFHNLLFIQYSTVTTLSPILVIIQSFVGFGVSYFLLLTSFFFLLNALFSPFVI